MALAPQTNEEDSDGAADDERVALLSSFDSCKFSALRSVLPFRLEPADPSLTSSKLNSSTICCNCAEVQTLPMGSPGWMKAQ